MQINRYGNCRLFTRNDLDGIETPTGLAAIRALLLTGMRRNESLSLRRDEVDAKNGCIRFGDWRQAAGDTVKSGEMRPIGAEAAKLLLGQPEIDDGQWVFPGQKTNQHFVGVARVSERVVAHARKTKTGATEAPPKLLGITVHVLRHSFAAMAASMNYSVLTIAGLLGHSVPGVTADYAHMPDASLVAAANRVSARMAAALDGKADADVIQLQTGT